MINILTASGGSRHAERAVKLSCELGHTQMATITVLTVTDLDEETPHERVQNRALEVAQLYKADITFVLSAGKPEQVIRTTAQVGYDLLIIGARGLYSLQDFFLGRNAIRLVKNLPVSTLVVRKKDSIKQILWRVARGPIDEKHVTLITHIVKSLQADITLLDVEPSANLFRRHQINSRGRNEQSEPDARLSQLQLRIAAATGRTVTCRVRTGIPEEVIIGEAAIGGFDLVAVSVQPRSGLGKLFTEDLQYLVARNIPVSVLLLN